MWYKFNVYLLDLKRSKHLGSLENIVSVLGQGALMGNHNKGEVSI